MPKKRLTAAERRAAARRYVEERGHLRQAYKVVHSAQPPSQEGTVQAPIPDPPREGRGSRFSREYQLPPTRLPKLLP
jgi:hypothetical protein